MAEFSVDYARSRPYESFRVKLRFEGSIVAGFSQISALGRAPEEVAHRVGPDLGSARRAPGQVGFEPITLERGLTVDADFVRWVNHLQRAEADAPQALDDLRRDLVVEVVDEAGRPVVAYALQGCWAAQLQATPELETGAVAIDRLVLECAGCTRDPVDGAPGPY